MYDVSKPLLLKFLLVDKASKREERNPQHVFVSVIWLRLWVSLGDRLWRIPWRGFDVSCYRGGLSVVFGGFSLLFPAPHLKSQLNIHIVPLTVNVVVWSRNHKRKCSPWDQWDDSTRMYVHSYYPKMQCEGASRNMRSGREKHCLVAGSFWVRLG